MDLAFGGCEWTTFMTWQSGEPADLPGNVRVLKDPKNQDVKLENTASRAGRRACCA
jgi:hypothetical protein